MIRRDAACFEDFIKITNSLQTPKDNSAKPRSTAVNTAVCIDKKKNGFNDFGQIWICGHFEAGFRQEISIISNHFQFLSMTGIGH